MTITALPTAPDKAADTPDEFSSKADAWVAALGDFVTEANALATDVNAKQVTASAAAVTAAEEADAAAASAASAIAAPGTSATSATSLSVGTGAKSLTVETGKDLVVGMKVIIASTAAPTTYMYGTITAYTSGTGALEVTVEYSSGSGTIAAWTVSLTGPWVQSLGEGQEWTNVSSSRELGVTYTNSTGRAIMVAVSLYMSSETAQSGGVMLVNGATVAQTLQKGSSTLHYETLTTVVPAGATYRVNGSGTASKSTWKELR